MRAGSSFLCLFALTPMAALAQSPSAGKTVFHTVCSSCHSAKPGDNLYGPSLFGIVNRPSGSVPGYRYSEAMKRSGLTWTPQKLEQYIGSPREVVPGTKMAYSGLENPHDRNDLVAYLATLHH